MKKYSILFLLSLSLPVLPSCSMSMKGTINFDLNGGYFLDESFSTKSLTGDSGTPVFIDIPNPIKEGYYFVGWKEKNSSGEYVVINKRLHDDGTSYYYYPYGEDTFYAYFEPLVTITFDPIDDISLTSPKYESENFSSIDNTLNGYSSKSILSTDYLPSVDASSIHKNFQYWYSEYPLVEVVDENKVTHYKIDTSQEKGIYQFDKAFKGYMQFLLDENITLYAYYTLDPRVTVHMNIEGVEDYSFYGKGDIEGELIEMMSEKFSIDYSLDTDRYYYPNETKDYRFDGFYLNDSFTSRFSLSSSIGDYDFDIYLKWNKRVTLTIDLNGGNINGQETYVINDYYQEDKLSDETFFANIPIKEHSTFIEYTYNGAPFSYKRDSLVDSEMTLIATYEDDLVLTLKYDYPDLYSNQKEENKFYYKKGDSIDTNQLDEFKLAIIDDNLITGEFYILDEENNKCNIPTSIDDDLTIYLTLNYRSKMNVISILSDGSEEEKTLHFPSYDGIEILNSYSDITDYDLKIEKEGNTFLYDGLYLDKELISPLILPISFTPNQEESKIINIYRKMTKAINITFKKWDDSTFEKSMKVIPNKDVSYYEDELKTLLGNYTRLETSLGEIVSDRFPNEDYKLYVID